MALEPRGVLVSKWLCHSRTDLRPWSRVGWARIEAGPWEERQREHQVAEGTTVPPSSTLPLSPSSSAI